MILYTEAQTLINLGGKYLENFILGLQNNNNNIEDLKMVIDILYDKVQIGDIEALLTELKDTESDLEDVSEEIRYLRDDIFNTKNWIQSEYKSLRKNMLIDDMDEFIGDIIVKLEDTEY